MDKVEACRLAQESGIDVPRHFKPSTREELDRVLTNLDFAERAYVLKIRMWDMGAADARFTHRVAEAGTDAVTVHARCEEIRAPDSRNSAHAAVAIRTGSKAPLHKPRWTRIS